jgi:hypothetical protein
MGDIHEGVSPRPTLPPLPFSLGRINFRMPSLYGQPAEAVRQ